MAHGAEWKYRSLSLLFCLTACLVTLYPTGSGSFQLTNKIREAFDLLMENSQFDGGDTLAELDGHSMLPKMIKTILTYMNTESKKKDLKKLKYRTFNGIGNNLRQRRWGASLERQRRVIGNAYDDGKSIPRYRNANGKLLPSARTVSVACFPAENKSLLDTGISQMFMQWGQYLDHDIILTEVEDGEDCCADLNEDGTHPNMFEPRSGGCFPILIEPGDRFFNTSCMPFKRSFGLKDKKSVRQQLNAMTSFIDGSVIYGSSELHAFMLRLNYSGLLQVSEGNQLPLVKKFACQRDFLSDCPFSGDSRVSVFPGLTGLHLLFHREHNRVARLLASYNPHWDDERLFQEARRINGALHQHITYKYYLPMLLGQEVMDAFHLNDEFDYHERLNPGVSNVFGAAAYRYGHSQINADLHFGHGKVKKISDLFFRPENFCYAKEKTLASGLYNQCRRPCQQVDNHFTTEVTDKNFLNGKGTGKTTDLPARNIHRGRDHGLPAYVKYVEKVAKFKKAPFRDLKPTDIPCWKDAGYESSDDVDIFVGGMFEEHVEGGLVGPTFAYIIGEQFSRFKFGDRFFYETKDKRIGFTEEQLESIKTQSLATVLCHNTDIKYIHPNVLATDQAPGNKRRSCRSYPDIDFSLWKEKKEEKKKPKRTRRKFGIRKFFSYLKK